MHRTLEMGISRADFIRLLSVVVDRVDGDGEYLRCAVGQRRCTVRLTPLPDRRLGAVAVPRHQVEIALDHFSESEADAFMERFRRAFMRGGG